MCQSLYFLDLDKVSTFYQIFSYVLFTQFFSFFVFVKRQRKLIYFIPFTFIFLALFNGFNLYLYTSFFLTFGNLDAYRDWGFAGDYVEGMWMMMQHSIPDDWVLATGETHTVSEFLDIAFSEIGFNPKEYIEIDSKYLRPNEVNHLLGDPSKAKKELGWNPKTSFNELVKMMVEEDIKLAEQEKILLSKGLITDTWNH